MKINGVPIEATFAEAFPMTAARVIVTAAEPDWAREAAHAATGYATSVIGCDAEAGIERTLAAAETPDGRCGVSLLFFAFGRKALEKALMNRIAQGILTCATTACFNGLPCQPNKTMRLGAALRFFGDGYQASKVVGGRRYWRVPVMDGEFLCEESFGVVDGIAGGNFLILAEGQAAGLAAAQAAVAAARQVPSLILPFPGGIVRAGSKVGSRYGRLRASTNEAYCPVLRGQVASALPQGVNAVYEIVIDGLDPEAVAQGMRVGIQAACRQGVIAISAGNYGGKLGPFRFDLHDILAV